MYCKKYYWYQLENLSKYKEQILWQGSQLSGNLILSQSITNFKQLLFIVNRVQYFGDLKIPVSLYNSLGTVTVIGWYDRGITFKKVNDTTINISSAGEALARMIIGINY